MKLNLNNYFDNSIYALPNTLVMQEKQEQLKHQVDKEFDKANKKLFEKLGKNNKR